MNAPPSLSPFSQAKMEEDGKTTSKTTVVATMRRRKFRGNFFFFFAPANLMLVCVSPLQQSPADEVIERFTIPIKVCLFEHIIDEGGPWRYQRHNRVSSVFRTFDDRPGGRLSHFLLFRADAEVESSRLPGKLLEPTHTAVPSTTIFIDREVDIFPNSQ